MASCVFARKYICATCRFGLRIQARSKLAQAQPFHNTSTRKQEDLAPQYQARELGDFYSDLVSTPLPKGANAKTELPEWVAAGGRREIEERAKKLFGSIEGSGYQRQTSDTPDSTWRTINGVPIPPRPAEPDNCCMSGCVHCVWDDYRDDVESWAVRLREAQAKGAGKGSSTTPKVTMARPEIDSASGSMDDDGGGSESLWDAPSDQSDADALFQDIPIGIREFMATEKRIRERKRARQQG